jgi:GMP synthase-like glutamine amidotransferase
MRAHYFQHVEFEGLGSIQPWLINSGYEITSSQFYKSYELPDVSDVDFLIVLGGPMSVNDEEIFPWLSEEKQYIKRLIAQVNPF